MNDDVPEPTAPLAQAVADASLPELYRQHRLALVRLGVLLLGDKAAAEDAVQDVFIRMWRRRALPRTPETALAYLRRATVNQVRSQQRTHALARRKVPLADPAAPGPPDIVELSEEHHSVLAALESLPHRQREVLVLRYYGNLPVAAVADALGIHEGTVKSQTARGIATLRTCSHKEQRDSRPYRAAAARHAAHPHRPADQGVTLSSSRSSSSRSKCRCRVRSDGADPGWIRMRLRSRRERNT